MNKLVPIGLGAAALVVALLLGSRLIGSPSSSVGGPAIEASPTASAAPASAAPSSTSPPPLTQTFTSQMHGISVSYPEGWTARAATEPWTDRPGVPQFLHPGIDLLHPPATDELFLAIRSQPIGDSTPEDWVAAQMAGWGCSTTEPIAVDGATGLIGADCRFASFTTAGRGYVIELYAGGDDFSQDRSGPYDRAWFEEVLATVQLHPADAVD